MMLYTLKHMKIKRFFKETLVALCVTLFSGAGVSPDAGLDLYEKAVF
jgi:hypothetical protein